MSSRLLKAACRQHRAQLHLRISRSTFCPAVALLWLAVVGEETDAAIEAAAATILHQIDSGIGKVCIITVCGGGEHDERWLPLIDQASRPTRSDEGCARVRIYGRKGWLRVLEGYADKAHHHGQGIGLMAGFDFRNGYGFDPGTYGNQRTGGLLRLMQEAMAQQALQQHGPGFRVGAKRRRPCKIPGAYGDAPQAACSAGCLPLQARVSRSSRRLTRATGRRHPRRRIRTSGSFRGASTFGLGSPGSSDRPDDQSSPSYYPSRRRYVARHAAAPCRPEDAGSFGGYGSTPAPMRIADASMMLPSAQGVRGIGDSGSNSL